VQTDDRALVRLRGPSAATNYAVADYTDELREFEAPERQEAPAALQSSALAATDDPVWPFDGAPFAYAGLGARFAC
jgi:hypothetical protein